MHKDQRLLRELELDQPLNRLPLGLSNFSGGHQPCRCHPVLPTDDVSEFLGDQEPFMRLDFVFDGTFTRQVERAQIVLRNRVAVVRRQGIPAQGNRIVLDDAFPGVKHGAKIILCIGIALFRRERVPLNSGRVVFSNTSTCVE